MAPRRKNLGGIVPAILCLLGLGAEVYAQCAANSTTVAAENGQTYCVCDSSYTGPECSTLVTVTSQEGCVIRDVQSLTMYFDGILENIDLQGQDLMFDMSFPMMTGRKYSSFQIGNCGVDKFKTYQVVTPAKTDDCRDHWKFSIAWSTFIKFCGWDSWLEVNKDAQLYQRYKGDFSYTATELTPIGTGAYIQYTPRLYTAASPFILDLQASFVTVGDNTPKLDVFSPVNLTAAIISQDITPGATTSSIDIGYVAYWPYQITSFSTDLILKSNSFNVASATIIKPDGTPWPNTPNNAPPCDGSLGVGKGDYTVDGSGCFQKITVQFVHGPACQVNATFSIPSMMMGCGAGIKPADCPITGAQSPATIDFTYGTDNLCANGTSAPTLIDGVVNVDRFIAVPPNSLVRQLNSPDQPQQASWMFGEPMYMRADFSGSVALQTVKLGQVQTDWQGNGFKVVYGGSGAQPAPSDMYTGTAEVQSAGGRRQAPVPLGFNIADQSLLLRHKVDATFANAADMPFAKNPESQRVLRVMITMEVAYTSGGTNRRRRRAASANGAAGSMLPALTIVNNPAMNPAPATNTDSFEPKSSGNSTLAIVLGVVLGLVVIAAVAGGVFFYRRRQKRAAADPETEGVVIGPQSDTDVRTSPNPSEPGDSGSLAAVSAIEGAATAPTDKASTA